MRDKIESKLMQIARRLGFLCKKVQTWNTINIPNKVETLIDIGVAHGTPELYNSFEFKKLVLIEPVGEYKSNIEKLAIKYNALYEPVGLSSKTGEVEINVNTDRLVRSSIHERSKLTKTNHMYKKEKIKLDTLDNIIRKNNLSSPFGIKIDTEGHELEVLKGSINTLKEASFVITETSVQKRFEDSYSFEELVCFMKQQSFSVSNVLSSEADAKGLVRYVDLLFVRQ